MIGAHDLKKWEQKTPSGNSGNASGNTETPTGSGFIIDVPTVPTKKHISYTRARNIFARLFKLNLSPIYMFFSPGSGNSGNTPTKPASLWCFRVPTRVPTVPPVPTWSGAQ